MKQQKDTAMEAVDGVCESEGVCDVMRDVVSKQPELEESMETQVSMEEAVPTAKSASTEERTDLSTMTTSAEPLKPRYSYR